VRGYQLPEILQKAQELGLCTLDYAKTDKQNMMKLIGGRVDLILVDTQVAQYHMKNGFTGYQNFIHPAGALSWTENLHIIVSKEHKNAQELMSLVDEALEEAKS
jgi:polar amino acid transport system substrate-binding protein